MYNGLAFPAFHIFGEKLREPWFEKHQLEQLTVDGQPFN